MKYNVKITSFSIDIAKPSLSFELDVNPVEGTTTPPVTPPLVPVEPNPIPPVEPVEPVEPAPIPPTNPNFVYLEDLSPDMNVAWRMAIQQPKFIKLLDNKEYFVDEYETVDPICPGVIGNLNEARSPTLTIGSWTKSVPSTLFYARRPHVPFAFVGVNVLQPKGQKFRTAIQSKYLFDGEINILKTCKFALIGSRAKDKDQLSWSLTELMYASGDSSAGFVDVIAKDVVHNGPNFSQLKTK